VKDKQRRAWLSVITGGELLVSHAGGSLLVATARAAGLSGELSARLRPWRRPLAIHDPGKIVLDLAVAVALGGDCGADIAVLRAQPGVFGLVASDPTVSRLVATLAGDVDAALGAIAAARAVARARVWDRAGAPVADGRVVIDLDATLVTAHSEKESATRTWKKTFGFHPLLAYADHGAGGTGEPVAGLLRPGNAGSNTAADHIEVFDAALAQLPAHLRELMSTDVGRCWCAPTPQAPPRPSPHTLPRRGWSSRWVPTCTTSTSTPS
jgi:Transposase DDE domain group 1